MDPLYTNKNSERGQATTEYILLLVVTVAIFTIASARLFTPVKKWADFYMGDYTYCLIDTGELPKEAGGNPTECEQLAKDKGFGTASTKADAAKSAEQLQAEAAARARAKALADANSAESARRAKGARSGRSDAGSSGAGNVNFDRPKGADSDGDNNGKSKQVARVSKNSRLGIIMGASGTNSQQRTTAFALPAEYANEQEKIMRREVTISQMTAVSAEEKLLKSKKLKMQPPKRKEATIVTEEVGGFSFGGMFRMATISGILAVIVFLVGSQVNSVMKGMDS
jgi:hypothetical protein